jgi:hypothetical protein
MTECVRVGESIEGLSIEGCSRDVPHNLIRGKKQGIDKESIVC